MSLFVIWWIFTGEAKPSMIGWDRSQSPKPQRLVDGDLDLRVEAVVELLQVRGRLGQGPLDRVDLAGQRLHLQGVVVAFGLGDAGALLQILNAGAQTLDLGRLRAAAVLDLDVDEAQRPIRDRP